MAPRRSRLSHAALVAFVAACASAATGLTGWLVAREETAQALIALELVRYQARRCEALAGDVIAEGPAPAP